MKEYENKSIEELRFEDYSANRKGPGSVGNVSIGGSGTLFGSAPSQTSTRQVQKQFGLFAQTSAPAIGFATTSAFGATGLFESQSEISKTTTSLSSASASSAGGGLFGYATQQQGAGQIFDSSTASPRQQTVEIIQPSNKSFEASTGNGDWREPRDQPANKPVRTAPEPTFVTPTSVAVSEIGANQTM